ncbi:hypothetical protein [uncultured Bacteroides sp.]|uniref:hypothetical protein n=1 Tax=uncultured Bacteroides sp. TaxID=162156 RepID=UPI0025CD5324|nr:hypothetical protein [uncultured Bacteroides sp.]
MYNNEDLERYYREMYRLNNHGISLSYMTLTYWLEKGAGFTKELGCDAQKYSIKKSSNVNCEEKIVISSFLL